MNLNSAATNFLQADAIVQITTGTVGTLGANRGGTGTTFYTSGDLLVADSTYTLTKIAPYTGTGLKFLSQTSGVTPTWQSVPQSGEFVYYLSTTTAGAITGTELMDVINVSTAIFSKALNSITGDTSVSTWSTPSGHPGITSIPAGLWSVHFDAHKTGGTKNLYLFAKIYKNDGTTRTLLATTQNSEYVTVTSSSAPQELDIELSMPAVTISTSDRIELAA